MRDHVVWRTACLAGIQEIFQFVDCYQIPQRHQRDNQRLTHADNENNRVGDEIADDWQEACDKRDQNESLCKRQVNVESRQHNHQIERGECGIDEGNPHLGKHHIAERQYEAATALGESCSERSVLAYHDRSLQREQSPDDHSQQDMRQPATKFGSRHLKQSGTVTQPLYQHLAEGIGIRRQIFE